jgi:hypothetical protein
VIVFPMAVWTEKEPKASSKKSQDREAGMRLWEASQELMRRSDPNGARPSDRPAGRRDFGTRPAARRTPTDGEASGDEEREYKEQRGHARRRAGRVP